MRALLFLVVAACSTTSNYRSHAIVDRLTPATGDAAAIRKLFASHVAIGGLPCPAFREPGPVEPTKLDALAACLASLTWRPSEHHASHAIVLATSEAFEIEARLDLDDRITWIGFASRGERDAWPTITASALQALRIDPQPLPDLGEGSAWLKICLDESGGSNVREIASSSPSAGRAFIALAQQWTFKPFVLHDVATPACANVRLQSPPGVVVQETLPNVHPLSRSGKEPLIVPPTRLERIRGETLIVPDIVDRIDLNAKRLIVSVELCADEAGEIESARLLKSSGVPNYDAKVLRYMRYWKYKPFTDGGVPIPICTSVTFLYSQKG